VYIGVLRLSGRLWDGMLIYHNSYTLSSRISRMSIPAASRILKIIDGTISSLECVDGAATATGAGSGDHISR